jgi:hypothetical protein
MSSYDDEHRGRQHGHQQRHHAAAAGPACGRCAGTGMFEGATCPVCQGSRVDPSGATRSYAAEGEGAPGEDGERGFGFGGGRDGRDGERGFGKTALGAVAGSIVGHKIGSGHGVLGALAGAVGGHVLGSVTPSPSLPPHRLSLGAVG